jgi:hypothetical protein
VKREFSVESVFSLLPRFNGILFLLEVAEEFVVTINHDECLPVVTARIPANAVMSTRVVGMFSVVPGILGVSAFAKIVASIVQRVVVLMIDVFSFLRRHNDPVHLYFPSTSRLSSVKGSSFFVPMSTPIESRQPFEIRKIHDRILSLRKRNQAVRFIEWLRNGVPLNPVLRHEFLLERNLCNAAILA